MSNDLVTQTEGKSTPYDRILRFMTDADIVLSAKEEVMLNRWIYADTLMRTRKFLDEDIVEKVADRFGVSKFTARNDLYQAQSMFGAARKFSKTYLLYNHAQEIGQQIERIKFDKSLAHLLPKLNDSYTKALQALPDEVRKDVLPPPVMNLFVVSGQQVGSDKSFDQAMAEADAVIAEDAAKQDDYADFEDLPDDDNQ